MEASIVQGRGPQLSNDEIQAAVQKAQDKKARAARRKEIAVYAADVTKGVVVAGVVYAIGMGIVTIAGQKMGLMPSDE